MTISWAPVVVIDIAGSVLTLLAASCCIIMSRQWHNLKSDDVFRHYIYLLTLAIGIFAISRSFGHLFKQLLLLNNLQGVWTQIAPYSGAVNSATFVIIFAFGIYFHRFQKVHLEIEGYRNNLERKIAARTAELEKANLTLENVLNNSLPICITSVDFDVLQANTAYYSIWPKRAGHTGHLKCYESRPGAHCHTANCPLEQIVAGKVEAVHEVTKKFKDVDREFILTAKPFRDSEGTLIGIVETFQDISERKKIEEALASERERLSVTLRSIGDGVITTDLEGRIILINKVTEQLTGWDRLEAVGRPVPEVFNIINERTGQPCNNPVDKVLATEEVVELESHTVLISKDGTRYNIEDSGAPIFDENSRIIGTVLVFRDVTEKRKTEKELLKVQKLESVGVLAGGIAHDFNNILAAIMGNINLSLRDPALTGKSQRLLDQAQKASFRARDLTQQLLTFAKGGQPVKETAALAEVVRESADFVLRGTKVACRYRFSDDLWLVDIDKGQISQVVQNIILNASDAMPNGGTIEVTCQNVSSANALSAAMNQSANYVELKVKDTGIGIPQESLDKIFDPYFTGKKQGTGLGLAITHSIVSKHDGYISVKSTEGVGSTFMVYLPAATSEPALAQETQAVGVKTRKARIMVMDDEELVRNVTREMLVELGHEVLLVSDGAEALQTYQATIQNGLPIDLIIMDLTVPGGMGGQEAVQKILAIDSQAKVIVSSGYSNDPIMAYYEEFGFSAAISKPHQLDDLAKVIGVLID